MTWQEIREQYPERWVLVEALDGSTQDGHRVFSAIRFVDDFDNQWNLAWDQYKVLHHAHNDREYYILHTGVKTLDIGVIDTFGRILN